MKKTYIRKKGHTTTTAIRPFFYRQLFCDFRPTVFQRDSPIENQMI
jgi:hypothetical protein